MKTKVTDQRVEDFLETILDEKKRQDAYQLLKIFIDTTNMEPKMWGDSMIGFGSYDYKYASGHQGTAFMVGFSPRKGKMTLYIIPWYDKGLSLLDQLGRYSRGVSCVYISRLSDIDVDILKQLIVVSIQSIQQRYPSRTMQEIIDEDIVDEPI